MAHFYGYINKKGKLTDKSVDRKAFVPLALRNTLNEIILNERQCNLFALSVRLEIIRQIGDNKGDDWIDWETLLNTFKKIQKRRRTYKKINKNKLR